MNLLSNFFAEHILVNGGSSPSSLLQDVVPRVKIRHLELSVQKPES